MKAPRRFGGETGRREAVEGGKKKEKKKPPAMNTGRGEKHISYRAHALFLYFFPYQNTTRHSLSLAPAVLKNSFRPDFLHSPPHTKAGSTITDKHFASSTPSPQPYAYYAHRQSINRSMHQSIHPSHTYIDPPPLTARTRLRIAGRRGKRTERPLLLLSPPVEIDPWRKCHCYRQVTFFAAIPPEPPKPHTHLPMQCSNVRKEKMRSQSTYPPSQSLIMPPPPQPAAACSPRWAARSPRGGGRGRRRGSSGGGRSARWRSARTG